MDREGLFSHLKTPYARYIPAPVNFARSLISSMYIIVASILVFAVMHVNIHIPRSKVKSKTATLTCKSYSKKL